MHGRLQPGDKLQGKRSGRECVVGDFVARGGWADIYTAKLEDAPAALKWYPDAKSAPAGERERLTSMTAETAPSAAVLWPMDWVEDGAGAWGYLRAWVPESFQTAARIISSQSDTSFRALLRAAFDLASAFRDLHGRGFCCRQINTGNLLVDPADGRIVVSNCEDMVAAGEKIGAQAVLFAAPEAWRDDAVASVANDLYGLAVLLFFLLVRNHPMIGQAECGFPSMSEGQLHCLANPVFIFHPKDARNQPAPDFHRAALVFWPRLPRAFRTLFTRTFTEGLENVDARAREAEWQEAALRARDSILVCANCRSETFYDLEQIRQAGGAPPPCVGCKQPVRLPPRLRIDGSNCRVVVLAAGLELFPHHTEGRLLDLSRPTARVESEPAALVNLTQEVWTVSTPDGVRREVRPGQSVTLTNGATVDFGKAKGEVRI